MFDQCHLQIAQHAGDDKGGRQEQLVAVQPSHVVRLGCVEKVAYHEGGQDDCQGSIDERQIVPGEAPAMLVGDPEHEIVSPLGKGEEQGEKQGAGDDPYRGRDPD